MLEILTIIFAGITVIAEAYIWGVAHVLSQHGSTFFVEMCLAVILPIITLFFLGASLGKRKPTEVKTSPQNDIDTSIESRIVNTLIDLAKEKPALYDESYKAADQVKRFAEKYNLLKEKTSYDAKISAILDSAKSIFYRRISEFLTIAEGFDQNEYRLFKEGQLDLKKTDLYNRKKAIFDNIFGGLDNITDNNEELILRLDEISQATNAKNNNTDWDTNTLMTLEGIESYINKVSEEIDLDKEINFDTTMAMRKLNGSANEF